MNSPTSLLHRMTIIIFRKRSTNKSRTERFPLKSSNVVIASLLPDGPHVGECLGNGTPSYFGVSKS